MCSKIQNKINKNWEEKPLKLNLNKNKWHNCFKQML